MDRLKVIDHLEELLFSKCKCFLHDNHRWVLPIIYFAQNEGLLPSPCNIVMFDYHRDDLTPLSVTEIRSVCVKGLSMDSLIFLCENGLSPKNDDWLKAGMELGMIAHAALFGHENGRKCLEEYKDSIGTPHHIAYLGLPLEEMDKGKLDDPFTCDHIDQIFEIMGLTIDCNGTGETILLDIDLDYFKVDIFLGSNTYAIPWPIEAFNDQFLT